MALWNGISLGIRKKHVTPVARLKLLRLKVSDSPNFFSELFFPNSVLLCSFLWAVDSWIPPLQFFQTGKGKAPKEAWGGHLSVWGINVTFLHPHEPQLSAMRCVTLNQIDPIWFASDLWWSFVHITPPCPRLFLSAVTRFLEKGKFSDRLCWLVWWESCLRCSKILKIRRKFEV